MSQLDMGLRKDGKGAPFLLYFWGKKKILEGVREKGSKQNHLLMEKIGSAGWLLKKVRWMGKSVWRWGAGVLQGNSLRQ
jgi:hypothetical protein